MPDSEPTADPSVRIVSEFAEWFSSTFIPHQEELLQKWLKAKNHNINPYLVAYKSAALTGSKSAEGIAEALITLSWLGQGLSTSFGMQFQAQLTKILRDVFGSTTSGIDVEFIDNFDGRKKYAQIKLGPDTINSDDVETIDNHFKAIKRLGRTNNLALQNNDLIIGVIYGSHSQLNANYKALKDRDYEIFVGDEFFEHVTGVPDLGTQLVEAAVSASKTVNVNSLLERAIDTLSQDPIITRLV